MSVRRRALAEIGSFHSDDHDDMDMCHRLMYLVRRTESMSRPHGSITSFLQRDDVGYSWRRCFFVNKGKLEAFRQMEGAADLSADIGFVGRKLSRGVSRGLREALRGRHLGCGEGRVNPRRGSFWQGPVMWQDKESGS